ncbi:ATP-binding cassette domain-containing protein [Metamycoplasma arthritidis]|nr:ATP-binding cassette domain-containing protein [Metamycoplasma arthritidis]
MDQKDTKRKIGCIPKIANFPKALSSREFLYYFACMLGLDKKIAKARIEEALKKFNIDGDEFKKSPYFFSSGQKKNMSIQALINDPKVLILDEEVVNLDVASLTDFMKQWYTFISEVKQFLYCFTIWQS